MNSWERIKGVMSQFKGNQEGRYTSRERTRRLWSAWQETTCRTSYRKELVNSLTHSIRSLDPHRIKIVLTLTKSHFTQTFSQTLSLHTNFLSLSNHTNFQFQTLFRNFKLKYQISTPMKMLTSQNSVKVAVIGAKSVGKSGKKIILSRFFSEPVFSAFFSHLLSLQARVA